jgi:hypothetical protein
MDTIWVLSGLLDCIFGPYLSDGISVYILYISAFYNTYTTWHNYNRNITGLDYIKSLYSGITAMLVDTSDII